MAHIIALIVLYTLIILSTISYALGARTFWHFLLATALVIVCNIILLLQGVVTYSRKEKKEHGRTGAYMPPGWWSDVTNNLVRPLGHLLLALLAVFFARRLATSALFAIPLALELIAVTSIWYSARYNKHLRELRPRLDTLLFVVVLSIVCYLIAFAFAHPGISFLSVPLSKQGVAITTAAFVFAVAMAGSQFLRHRFETEAVLVELKRITRSHVVETTLADLDWSEHFRDVRGYSLNCYHSTSHLFGYWLCPTIKGKDKLSEAMSNLPLGSVVRLIGPSYRTFKYLVLSRLFKKLYYTMTKQEVDKSYGNVAEFACSVIRDADPTHKELIDFFCTDSAADKVAEAVRRIMEKRCCQDWWNLIRLIHWSLLLIYYTKLNYCYREADRLFVSVEFANRSCYDKAIMGTMQMYSLGKVPTGQNGGIYFEKAINKLDSLFFPHPCFATICPPQELVAGGTEANVLFSHDVLETLNFDSLELQSRAILRITNRVLVQHHNAVFEREWKYGAERLTLPEVRAEWKKYAEEAKQGLELVKFSELAVRMKDKGYVPK